MAHTEAPIDQDSARSAEPRVRGGSLPVVVNGGLVFVPFDADMAAASSFGTLLGELQHVAVGLDDARGSPDESVFDDMPARHSSRAQIDLTIACPGRQELPEIYHMKRRELIRIMSVAAAFLAKPSIGGPLDWERLDYFSHRTSRPDSAVLDDYARLNAHLWRFFTSAKSKHVAFPLVRQQLDVLTDALQRSKGSDDHQRLCALAGDLFQLAGEIFFDCNQYTDAAHCYALAATASKEANAFDLWACTLTRHAFIGIYERRFDKSAPMLELAAGLAGRGDTALSTRHWVHAVRAQALAGLGQEDACQRALDAADQVHQLTGQVHTGGWLRFDGSRLAEESGTCYVELRRPDLGEVALASALSQDLSPRRRGSVLTDLAMIGVQRRDPDKLVVYADAALDLARQTGSGVIGRKLQGLQNQLAPFLGGIHVRHLNKQITALTGGTTTR